MREIEMLEKFMASPTWTNDEKLTVLGRVVCRGMQSDEYSLYEDLLWDAALVLLQRK